MFSSQRIIIKTKRKIKLVFLSFFLYYWITRGIIEYENYFQFGSDDNMLRSESYKTKQKDLITKTIKSQNKEFTINDIYASLKGSVGLTTIYRMVDKLVLDGVLNKYITKDNITYYQYLEKCSKENHFYLKCEKCGNIIHIDCKCIGELFNHILNNHHFKVNKENIIIKGICNNCQ